MKTKRKMTVWSHDKQWMGKINGGLNNAVLLRMKSLCHIRMIWDSVQPLTFTNNCLVDLVSIYDDVCFLAVLFVCDSCKQSCLWFLQTISVALCAIILDFGFSLLCIRTWYFMKINFISARQFLIKSTS